MTGRSRWPKNPVRDAKYQTREHRQERARLVALMDAQGFLVCAQPECLLASRVIHLGERWHLGHDDSGTQLIGAVHVRCNQVDGAKRGNRRSRGLPDQDRPRRWVV